MSDAEWDADDFKPPTTAVRSDKWEGEDEDDIKDNWDDENNEEEENANKPTENGEAIQVKKKKSVKEKLAEKAEQRRKEQEEKKRQELEERSKPMSAEEMAAEKLRQQKLQEDADLELAVQAFGVGTAADATKGQIDGMEPSSKEEFDKFEELLRQKISKYEKSIHYVPFLEGLFRQLALDLEAEDVKRLGSTLTALSSEKVKQQKSTKIGGKKSKQKAKLTVGKATDDAFIDGGDFDEYDDFM